MTNSIASKLNRHEPLSKESSHLLIASVFFVGIYLSSFYNYLLFHTLAEFFSIIIASGIFMVAWHSRRLDNIFLIFIGISFAFVGLVDLIHALSYKGLGIITGGQDTNLATQLWVLGRYLQSGSLLLALIFMNRKFRVGGLFLIFAALTALGLLSIFYWKIFPVSFVEGVGLTAFKKISEYVVSILFLISGLILYQKRHKFDRYVWRWLNYSILLTMASEIAFVFYATAYSSANLIGHLFKIAAYYFIYLAIVEKGLARPFDLLFRNLKESEEALRSSNDFNNYLLATMPFGIDIVDEKGDIVFMSQNLLKTYGQSALGKKCWETYKDNKERCKNCPLVGGVKIGQTASLESAGCMGGKFLQITHTGIVYQKKRAFLEIFEDITKRKTYEEALRKSERRYHAVVEDQTEFICRCLPDGTLTFVNESYCRYYGQKQEALIGFKYFSHLPESEQRRELEHLKQFTPQKPIDTIEHQVVVNGEMRWQHWTDRAIFDENGRLTEYQFVGHDVTQRKQAEQELKVRTQKLEKLAMELQKFQLAVEGASDQVVIVNDTGRIIYANKAAQTITGYANAEMLGQTPALWVKELRDESGAGDLSFEDVYKQISAGAANFLGEGRNLRKNREKYITNFHLSPVVDDEGRAAFSIIIEIDITKVKEVDRAKTEFVSLASHQLRTPLTSISLSAELLLRGISGPLDPKQKRFLQEIYSSTGRMTELVDNLLNISRIELGTFTIKSEEVPPAEVADQILEELSGTIKNKNIKLIKDYDSNLGRIKFDRNILHLAMENLLTNALRYTPAGGNVTLAMLREKNDFLIKVSDTGCGIPATAQSQVFNKLFRADNAKEVCAEGTGLGLYMVKSILDKTGSKIWFESQEGAGSIFYVSILLVNKQ